ncbi:MAG: hypothetical protein HY729_05150 [Candidatus Rokubacteria bacterium]|nr:hypothetical protein [Candidatus Rokubacteria bacterium]
MKRAGYWIIFGITCLLVVPRATNAVDNESERATLKGLPGVLVLVEDMNPEVERAGLARATLQTDVELKLRQAGIAVLSTTEMLAAPGYPHLYLNVATGAPRTAPGLYVYSIQLSLKQQVVVVRNTAVSLASTWSTTAKFGTVGADRLSSVRESVRDQVDKFINAWLSVNPK